MAFTVFLDACVLYQATLRDVLLTLAEKDVYQIRWSPDVLDEMERNVARRANAPKRSVAVNPASRGAAIRVWCEAGKILAERTSGDS